MLLQPNRVKVSKQLWGSAIGQPLLGDRPSTRPNPNAKCARRRNRKDWNVRWPADNCHTLQN